MYSLLGPPEMGAFFVLIIIPRRLKSRTFGAS
nr:MAG TPA: hypothetical protein [Caudoviricetes sp.]